MAPDPMRQDYGGTSTGLTVRSHVTRGHVTHASDLSVSTWQTAKTREQEGALESTEYAGDLSDMAWQTAKTREHERAIRQQSCR
jgi:hypothetical protein